MSELGDVVNSRGLLTLVVALGVVAICYSVHKLKQEIGINNEVRRELGRVAAEGGSHATHLTTLTSQVDRHHADLEGLQGWVNRQEWIGYLNSLPFDGRTRAGVERQIGIEAELPLGATLGDPCHIDTRYTYYEIGYRRLQERYGAVVGENGIVVGRASRTEQVQR